MGSTGRVVRSKSQVSSCSGDVPFDRVGSRFIQLAYRTDDNEKVLSAG